MQEGFFDTLKEAGTFVPASFSICGFRSTRFEGNVPGQRKGTAPAYWRSMEQGYRAVDQQKRHNQIDRAGMSGEKFAEGRAEQGPDKAAGGADQS